MNNLTFDKIDADISYLMDGVSTHNNHVPSPFTLLKLSMVVPFASVFFTLISMLTIYVFYKGDDATFSGYFSYLLSDGWVVLVPTIVIGMFFSFMAYNNLIMYMSVPKGLREKSIILKHLRIVVYRTAKIFMLLMLAAALVSGFYSRLAFAIPLLEVMTFFGVNIVVSAEINRLGAGIALEKISKLISKI
jgi:hypothetical protein